MVAEALKEAGANTRTPPYTAWPTFLTLIDDLKANGVPPRIDRSALKRFSGGVGSQLLMGMKSLGLLGEQNVPTSRLAALVKARGTSEFAHVMKEVLKYGYPFLANLDLMTATPGMFAEAFKNATGAKEDVLKKCRRFYLAAAEDVGVPIGPRLADQRSASPTAPKSPKRAPTAQPRKSPTRKSAAPPEAQPDSSIQSQLVGKFPQFDPSWPEEIKAKWFEGFNKLMASTIIDQNQKGDQ